MTDITDMIDQRRVTCVNESRENAVKNLFDDDPTTLLESKDSTKLLLYLPMRTAMRITHIFLQAPRGTTIPTTAKLFANTLMELDDLEYVSPTQEIELDREFTAQELEDGVTIPLRSRFSTTTALAILFDNEAEGATQTVLSNLRLFGTTPPVERNYYSYSRPRGC